MSEDKKADVEIDPCLSTQYARQDDVDLESLEAILATDPDNEEFLDMAGFVYYSNDMLDKALTTYQRLCKLNPRKASYHYFLANTLLRLGRKPDALVELNLCITIDGTGEMALKARKRLAALSKAHP